MSAPAAIDFLTQAFAPACTPRMKLSLFITSRVFSANARMLRSHFSQETGQAAIVVIEPDIRLSPISIVVIAISIFLANVPLIRDFRFGP